MEGEEEEEDDEEDDEDEEDSVSSPVSPPVDVDLQVNNARVNFQSHLAPEFNV